MRSRVGNMSESNESWYFDTATGEVAQGKISGWNSRLGPYASEAEARKALETAEARSKAAEEWDEE